MPLTPLPRKQSATAIAITTAVAIDAAFAFAAVPLKQSAEAVRRSSPQKQSPKQSPKQSLKQSLKQFLKQSLKQSLKQCRWSVVDSAVGAV